MALERATQPHLAGYGQQTALVAPRLGGWDTGISAFYGLEGNVIRYGDIPVYPGISGTFGNETIRQHAQIHFGELRDGLVVTLLDVWILDPDIWSQLNVASWVPVDHEPTPPPIVEFFRKSGAVPIAMSRFGEREMKASGLDPLYVPHAVDCSVYKPQDAAREATGMPEDAFIVGMVAANKGIPSRKCFPEAFQAFKALHDKRPEARLYVHAEMTGRFGGLNLLELVRSVGLPSDAVLFCDQYRAVHYPFSGQEMAQVYSSLDVLLMPSAGEGFGIPAIEAQACGTPVIASDFSAQPELLGAGWLVSGRRVYTRLKAWQFLPDVEDIVEALESAWRNRRNPAMPKKACAHAKQYHVDRVVSEFMLPALEQAHERLK